MRIAKYMILALAFLLLVAYIAGYFLPDSAHVERSQIINRPASAVFAVLDQPRRFNEWSPWFEPNKRFGTTYSYHGPNRGEGASIQWRTPKDVTGSGSGEMKITISEPNRKVVYALVFENREPVLTGFEIESLPGDRSRVTWSYDAEFGNSIIGRYFGQVLDKAVGPDYEAGLANLKNLLEKGAAGEETSSRAGLESNPSGS